jgi:hypothetical protein
MLHKEVIRVSGLTFAGNGLQIYLLFRKEIDTIFYYSSF